MAEFYIISKPIYRRKILVEKVILILVAIVNLILKEKDYKINKNYLFLLVGTSCPASFCH
jgi:REP element-mobilizing transposase RayT